LKPGLVLPLLLLAGAPASAQSVISPYRFSSPDDRAPSGLDAEKARSYRDQLRPAIPYDAPRDAGDAANRQELRRELSRIDRVLESAPPPPPARNVNAPPTPPPLGGGARSQPTPAEIEERLAEREGKPPLRRTIPVNPVYDLFGERLQ
jgi:hypothetical protein